MESLRIASRALERNTVPSRSGPLFCCGPSHFHFFWLRDFSLSVPGLLISGHAEVVKHHLIMSLNHVREDGLMPRSFDVIDPKLRVVLGVFGIHASKIWPYTKHDLRPEFTGEHATIAADSNVLVLDACLRYMAFTGDDSLVREHSESMKRAFDGILKLQEGELLAQPAFSDWQDSARRTGHVFYLNFLFCRLVRDLQALGVAWAKDIPLETWVERLWTRFFEPRVGLFLSELEAPPRFSMEGQLWAIESDLFARYIERTQLWNNLKASHLWKPMPGLPVWPEYPWRDISWTTKVVGLRHYHDQFWWSWLMGEALKICAVMKDRAEAERLAAALEALVRRDDTVYEIYEWRGAELVPVRRHLYRSEYDFSWGSAKIVEGITAFQKAWP